MARYRGTTKERGLGAEHVADKNRLLALHRDGDPCWRCGQPMYKTQALDRDHVIDRALGGTAGPAVLAHASCNRAAGAAAANQRRSFTLAATTTAGANVTCRVCGQHYTRAARSCEMCGAHYHPTYGEQRTCGRVCGRELQQRNKRAAGWVPKAERPKPPRKERDRKTWPSSKIQHYTCRYCGKPGVVRATRQRREVCPARECQLARLAANNLITRKGMTREQADAAVVAYRAEGDHRKMITPERAAADRKWAQTVAAVRQATARASRAW